MEPSQSPSTVPEGQVASESNKDVHKDRPQIDLPLRTKQMAQDTEDKARADSPTLPQVPDESVTLDLATPKKRKRSSKPRSKRGKVVSS